MCFLQYSQSQTVHHLAAAEQAGQTPYLSAQSLLSNISISYRPFASTTDHRCSVVRKCYRRQTGHHLEAVAAAAAVVAADSMPSFVQTWRDWQLSQLRLCQAQLDQGIKEVREVKEEADSVPLSAYH